MNSKKMMVSLAAVALVLGALEVGSAAACTCPTSVDVECQPVAASSLSYTNSLDDTKDKLSFTVKGAQGPSSFNGLGNPGASDSSCLCLYQNGSLTQLAEIPAGGLCNGGDPCWVSKPGKFWKFKDASGANDGVNALTLSHKAASATSGVKLKAKGVGLVDLSLPVTGPVVVQLRTGYEYCVGAEAQTIIQDPATGKLKLKQKLDGPYPACDDGLRNGYEEGVDCGGSCVPCVSCSNGLQDGDETGIDCGGSCGACVSCSNGLQDGDETGVDCGGSCGACVPCANGLQDGDETGVDCGGSCPLECPTGVSKRIFITGMNFAAWQLADQATLDLRCNELAQAYDPGAPDFYAWTCTSADDDPESRFTKYSDPYVRFSDGVVIASGGWNQLVGGAGLDNAVLKDESGAIPMTDYVWTGTRTDGTCGAGATPEAATCSAWTTDAAGESGGIGLKWANTFDLWNAYGTVPCSSYIPIYCVEQ